MRFAERLKQLRKQLNLNQEDFANSCNVQFTAISKYENELIKPSFDMLAKIAMAYNVNLNWLINEWGSMFIETPQRQIIKTGTDNFSIEVVENNPKMLIKAEEKHNLNLESDLKVEYYGVDDNYTKIYHKNGDVEYQNNKDVNNNLQLLAKKLQEVCQDKNQFEFVMTAIKALDDKEALTELKYLIKGMEISKQ